MKKRTSQRVAIADVFKHETGHMGVATILKTSRKTVPSLNQATVYRNLKLLVEEGCLHKVSHPLLGTLFERAESAHHHYFHCRVCERTIDIQGCSLKNKNAVPDGFLLENHEIFLFGICRSCYR